jgi:hypothetical protein
MSANWWNGEQITASRQNRHLQEEVPHRDTDVGDGTQPSKFSNYLEE